MAKNETDLDDLFLTARRQRDHLPADLAARMLADAETVRSARIRPERTTQRRSWRQAFDFLGGWRGMGGLATACAAGIWIGLAPPEFLPDPVDLLMPQDDTQLISDLTLSGLYVE